MTTAPPAIHAVIGQSYDVPCMLIEPEHLPPMFLPKRKQQSTSRWVPILGPEHTDVELGFRPSHHHIDWRFVPRKAFQRAHSPDLAAAHVLITSNLHEHELLITKIRMRCHRPAPYLNETTFVQHPKFKAMQELMCSRRIKNGICPHKGLDLKPFADEDGTAICPAHGLRWNLRTGELIARRAGPTEDA